MKLYLLLITFVTFEYLVNCADSLNSSEWRSYKDLHKKLYKNHLEDQKRFEIWMTNKKVVEQHNIKFERGEVSYKMAINKFSDLNASELEQFTGFKIEDNTESYAEKVVIESKEPIADNIDWRAYGAVTGVKNQGSCGSCYTFSVTGVIEGQHFIKNKKLVSLSEQQIIDCFKSQNSNGCRGGNMNAVYEYIKSNGGIDTEASYPYYAVDNRYCVFNPNNIGAKINGYSQLTVSEDNLKNAVASIGPISVGISVQNSFYNYASGIYYDSTCRNDIQGINHAVLVVGYGSANGIDYWLVKNSWGNWGENGYIRMARNQNNLCGIATWATYPKIIAGKDSSNIVSQTQWFANLFFNFSSEGSVE